jgi:hypothetical protein
MAAGEVWWHGIAWRGLVLKHSVVAEAFRQDRSKEVIPIFSHIP